MAHPEQASAAGGRFQITPRGPYSLRAAAAFAFGPKEAALEDRIKLAFVQDGFGGSVAVSVHQDQAGLVHGDVQGTGETSGVRAQVARILSLDWDATTWAEVGGRDPVMRELQARRPGFRPVLFHSPYEAAAWSVLYGRKTLAQVRRLRERIATTYGTSYTVEGEKLAAFPPPQRLLQVAPEQGLAEVIVNRLHAVARFALEGRLEVERLRSAGEAEALADLRRLPGVGEFFSGLILYRAAGPVDLWHHNEKLDACLRHYYGVDPTDESAFVEIGERLRPFRSWAMVLLRYCGEEDGVA